MAPTPSAPVPDNAQGQTTDELGNKLNSFADITSYNNYYEFSTAKDAPAMLSKNFKTSPWSVQVGGLVQNPKTYAIEDLLKSSSRRNAFTACAAWRPGAWSSPGPVSN